MLKPKILLIDDDKEFLKVFGKKLSNNNFSVKECSSCEDALRALKGEFFDIVVCDVRLPFFGMSDGGLEMAKEVSERSPATFTIIVSQYVTDYLVNEFMASVDHKRYCFLTKDDRFLKKLLEQARKILDKKTMYVCMPFSEDFDDVYELGIKKVAADLHFKCERADEIQHNGGILERVYESIKSSHIIIAEISTKNPNVYYEIGYAHALGREVILLTQDGSVVPIDLRNFNHIVYSKSRLVDFQKALRKRIESLLR